MAFSPAMCAPRRRPNTERGRNDFEFHSDTVHTLSPVVVRSVADTSGYATEIVTPVVQAQSFDGSSSSLSSLDSGIQETALPPVLASKPADCNRKPQRSVQLATNLFQLAIPEDFKLYRYSTRIFQHSPNRKDVIELTKGCSEESFRAKSRAKCYEVYVNVVGENRDFFRKPFACAYDRWHSLFCADKLDIEVGSSKTFTVTLEDEKKEEVKYSVTVEPTIPFVPIDMNDFRSLLHENLNQRDYTSIQALEIITSQVVFFKDKYVQLGRAFFDKNRGNSVGLGAGRVLATGLQKSVKIVEGDESGPMTVVQVDAKNCALYKVQPVVEAFNEISGIKNPKNLILGCPNPAEVKGMKIFEYYIKGVVVKTTYGRRASFTVHGISSKSASQISVSFFDEGLKGQRDLGLTAYFKTKYGVELKYSYLPCLVQKVVRKGEVQFNNFPFELCDVAENQRVPINKQTPEQMQKMIKETALVPCKHANEIMKRMEDTKIQSNKFLASLGLQMCSAPIIIEGHVLSQPGLVYGGSRREVVGVDSQGVWAMKNKKWLERGRCDKWAAVCMDPDASSSNLGSFLDLFVKIAVETGIRMGDCIAKENVVPDSLVSFFREAAKQGIEFVLLIFPKERNQLLKDHIKYLEHSFEIITQCVRTPIMKEVGSSFKDSGGWPTANKARTTLINILSKTNMKLGGLNYGICLETGDEILFKWFDAGAEVIYVGCDVNHAAPQTAEERRNKVPQKEPSVVGFVSSTAENKLKYTGEIQFQRRSEEVLNMKELMVQMLYRYQRGSKGGSQLPKVIIFFRDGVSEGQFKMVLENEIPQLREAFAEVGGKIYCPKLTFVVVIKRHMLRLFVNSVDPNGSAPQQDFPVGTVVDKGIVHPTAWEFYLKSHLAIQGTAKASKYCVLLDENKFTSDELEVVCYILCYGHQIVTKSVSLPAPVYGAHEMAERGKRLWRAFVNAEGSSSGKSSASLNLTDETDWVLMTEKFRVSGTKFTDRKYWA